MPGSETRQLSSRQSRSEGPRKAPLVSPPPPPPPRPASRSCEISPLQRPCIGALIFPPICKKTDTQSCEDSTSNPDKAKLSEMRRGLSVKHGRRSGRETSRGFYFIIKLYNTTAFAINPPLKWRIIRFY